MSITVRSSSYVPLSGDGDVSGGSVSCAKPSGVVSGDLLVAVVARSQTAAATTSFTSSGWTSAAFFAGSSVGNDPVVGVLWKAAGGSEPTSYTFTSTSYSGTDQFVVHILALTGASTTSPFVVTPVKTDAGSTSSSVVAPSVSPSVDDSLLVCWFACLYFGSGTTWTTPSGMTERVDRGGVWLHPATDTELRPSSGATGTRTAVHSVTPAHPGRSLSFAIRPGTITVSPTGIASAQAFGTPTLLSTLPVAPAGIASVEAFGSPTVEIGKIRPVGVDTAEEWGTPAIAAGTVTISPAGIGGAEAFGEPRLLTTFELSGQMGAVSRSIKYDLVLVARVPSAMGPPTLLQVDPIVWSGLSWSDELSKPQRLDVSASMATLTDAALQRFARARELPSELHLYRGGRLVFAGPLVNGQRQGETVTAYAVGLLGYAQYWRVDSDLVFTQADQFAIAKGLVDHWQGLEYGNFGIDTSAVGESGVLRDATYLAAEDHNIGTRLEELGRRNNGFDIEVDPITRRLQMHHPIKGVDRSSGPDAVIFDRSNITNANVAWSTAPGDVASEAYGVGTGGDTVRSVKSNVDVRAQFGRCAVAASFDRVSQQATLDEHTQALLDARQEALIIPGPDVRVTPDVDPTTYSVGDTVSYVLSDRLGVTGAFRLRKRTIKVSDSGRELASFEFA